MRSSAVFAVDKPYTVLHGDIDGERCFILTCHFPHAFKSTNNDKPLTVEDIHSEFKKIHKNTYQIHLTGDKAAINNARKAISTLKGAIEILKALDSYEESLSNQPTQRLSN